MEFIGLLFFIVFFSILGAAPIVLLLIGLGIIGIISLIPDELTSLFKLSLCGVLVLVSIISLITI